MHPRNGCNETIALPRKVVRRLEQPDLTYNGWNLGRRYISVTSCCRLVTLPALPPPSNAAKVICYRASGALRDGRILASWPKYIADTGSEPRIESSSLMVW